MRDMEKGAVIMVNSWGTYWGNNGKAYIMYKLLAETPENGGIQSKKVFSINVKETQEPELLMRVKMNHNNRSAIKVLAGISTDINASRPEHILDFPLFNNQGGDFEMNGSNTNPIEVSFDISELLSYTAPSVDCKYFLMIKEDDQYSSSTGTIIDFSVIDKAENQITCAQHNLSIVNNDTTFLSLTKSTVFDAPAIADTYLPAADAGILYSYQMSGEGGSQPYVWKTIINYEQQEFAETFPAITSNQLPTTNNDDGISVKTLEFPFLFYGEYYNQVTVSTDGSIVFEPVFEYLRTEKDIMSKKMIAVFAADLNIYPADGDGIFYQGDQYSATFRWKTSLFDNQSANIDVAVKLFPDGKIEMYYGSGITQNLDWASGISDGKGTYLISENSGAAICDNDRFSYTPDDYPTGMYITNDGLFTGITPDVIRTWNITFKLTDYNNIFTTKTISFESELADLTGIRADENKCFPNPFDDETVFETEKNYVLEIYNLQGALIYQNINSGGKTQIKWKPGKTIPAGIYIYKISDKSTISTGKIIKY